MIVISPAKNMKFDQTSVLFDSTQPYFKSQTNFLVNKLKNLSIIEIKSLMTLSDNLSTLNFERYKNFSENSKYINNAIFVFNGDTYIGLNAKTLSKDEVSYSQKTLRILSGLYGLLKPLDSIQPYRLEMGCSLKRFIGKNLYEFWSDLVTNQLNLDMKSNNSEILFNLASSEYFKCINQGKIKANIITPVFYQKREGKLKNIGIISKKSRGQMSNFIIKKRIKKLNDLKTFNVDGYNYDSFDQKTGNIFFIKE